MKKIIALLFLTTLGWGAQGDSFLTVSSGTFLAIDGQTIANSNFRQTVVIGDTYSVAGVAQVDPVTGLTVHIASSSLTNGGVPVTVIGPGIQLASTTLNVNVPTAIQLASTTLNVNVPTAIQLASTTINVNVPTAIQLSSAALQVYSSSNGVFASTTNIVQPASVPNFRIDLTTTVVVHDFQGIQLASTTLTVLTPLAIQLASTTINVNIPTAIQLASTTLTVVFSSNGVNASTTNVVQPASVPAFRVDLSTTGTQANPFYVNVPLSLQLSSGTPSNPFTVNVPLSVQLTSGTPTNPLSVNVVNVSTGLQQESNFASYHASSATQVAASATDIATISGNATNNLYLTGIRVSCTQTTAGIVHMSILKRSTGDSPVVTSTMTVVPDDSGYGAAASTAAYVYTANPTRGTLVGQLDSYNIGCMAPATTVPNDIYISPAQWRKKPIVLRGFVQTVAVSLATGVDGTGVTVTGGVFNVTFEFTEGASFTPY
jgi:hypothetical protein